MIRVLIIVFIILTYWYWYSLSVSQLLFITIYYNNSVNGWNYRYFGYWSMAL